MMIDFAMLIAFVAITWTPGQCDGSGKTYSVMIDAGSSGSRVRIYSWDTLSDEACNDLPDLSEVDNLQIKPGISSYSNNLPGLEGHMSTLIDKAKETVPSDLHSETPIYVFSTAGKQNFFSCSLSLGLYPHKPMQQKSLKLCSD